MSDTNKPADTAAASADNPGSAGAVAGAEPAPNPQQQQPQTQSQIAQENAAASPSELLQRQMEKANDPHAWDAARAAMNAAPAPVDPIQIELAALRSDLDLARADLAKFEEWLRVLTRHFDTAVSPIIERVKHAFDVHFGGKL